MKNNATSRLAISSLAVLFSTLVAAESDHQPLQISAELHFEEVYQAAHNLAPELPTGTARQQMADSYTALGQRWITNRPSWETNLIDDAALNNAGLREFEFGVKVDLWRPGQRSQAKALGSSYQGKASAWQRYYDLMIAGRVRTVLADISKAESIYLSEQQATAAAEQLLEITTSLFESGAVPELDLLQARGLLLEQRKLELQAEAELVDAERTYSVMTGLNIRPATPHKEIQSSLDAVQSTHPYLQLLQSEIDLAQSNIEKVRQDALGSPSMTLGVKKERALRQQPYVDSFGLSFSIPFGGSAAVSATVSNARSAKVDQEINYTKALQELSASLHEIEHELHLIEESLDISREQAELGQRHWEMSQVAFETGETTLAQVVLALRNAQSSAQEFNLLQLQQQRRISEYNQAVGELP